MAANSSAVVAALIFAAYAALVSATTYTVGGVHSWMTGVDYAAWASDKKFAVGDKLLFSYARTDHTVTEVSRDEYDACSSGSGALTLSNDNSSGLTTVTLAAPGMRYFICAVPDHCASGMKLAVNVSAAPSGTGDAPTSAAGGAAQVPAVTAVPIVIVAAAATGVLIELALL